MLSYSAFLFLDKHGQLGVWEPFALPEEVADEDDEPQAVDNGSDGRYWRLQPHWPATAKSSISCVKINPLDSHSVSYMPCSAKSSIQ